MIRRDAVKDAAEALRFMFQELFPPEALQSPLVVADESVAGEEEDIVSLLYTSNKELLESLITIFVPYVQQEALAEARRQGHSGVPTDLLEALDGSSFLITLLNDIDSCTPFRVCVVKAALKRGLAVCHMPGITLPHLASYVKGVNYALMRKKAAFLKSALSSGGKVIILTKERSVKRGRDREISFVVPEGACEVCDGQFPPGHIGNLPAGECYVEPEPGTACGEIVLDGSFLDMVIGADEELVLHFEDGRLQRIESTPNGTDVATTLKKRLEFRQDGEEWALAEFAVGLNTKVHKLTGSELVDEKAALTGHIAIGQPVLLKEETGQPHCDLVFRKPTVLFKGRTLVNKGQVKLSGGK